ncbi:MAG: hypothetical protein JXR76_20535 [Deltaproteobacteria bacterium]|nr:hypothetical protein [Deltaproteobacteria bacterium]
MNIVWEKKYNVNVLEIDEHYSHLIESFNELVKLVKRGTEPTVISASVDLVHSHVQNCFNTEETYFHKLGFCDMGDYRHGHSACLKKLSQFKRSYDRNQPLINLAHVEGIARALMGHIASSHSDFNAYMKENGIRRFIRAQA